MAVDVAPVVEVEGACVRFGSDLALDHVDFRMFAGEVHSLMGENGAGKSTLIKLLTGALSAESGVVRVGGGSVRFSSPQAARAAGISAVYQEIDLLPNLSVAENVLLGQEPRRWGGMDWSRMRSQARDVLAELGLDLDPSSMLGTHSLAVQQLVAIARAIATDVKVLVLDEPTSSLDLDDVAELFRVIRDLKERGVAILFVSHFLDQVYEICDRITVLREGHVVGEYLTRELLRVDLVAKMLGRSISDIGERQRVPEPEDARPPLLEASGVTVAPRIRDADITIYEGDVLGMAGLLGSGRTELARALTGVDRLGSGVVELDGKRTRLADPHQGIRLGVVYSSENRRAEGIIAGLSIEDNIALALQAQRGVLRRMSTAHRRELALSWIDALGIRPADPDRPVGTLSGGNQQKVVLARLLALSPRLLVLDEPTRGIDVGTKVDIQKLVGELADNGLSLVFISAELEEVLRVSDRVAVLRDGEILETVPADQLTIDALLALIAQATPVREVLAEGSADV
ncbi:sugar ABC transporter ATP-binding protein [Microbacterium schleiferi]|uniref:Sugar ABC transporter ATP-binding protein n=1 Tax=Microbacterium schleiferi TaxID=69362 RepID=A0A7S8MVZ1_9MICO|nr:sugar ABC transporter ATP-binding protein [Microbacterium schleiferi]QPE04295.1 sugar ABC transporter ATP-binding protein [Microbacterium schleiferi]